MGLDKTLPTPHMRVSKLTIKNLFYNVSSLEAIWGKYNMRHIHIAMVIKRGKMIASATNQLGSRTKGCGYDERTIHAERAVLKKIGDYTKLEGAVLVVIRFSRDTHDLINSKPCEACQRHLEKCVKDYGLRRVYYS